MKDAIEEIQMEREYLRDYRASEGHALKPKALKRLDQAIKAGKKAIALLERVRPYSDMAHEAYMIVVDARNDGELGGL